MPKQGQMTWGEAKLLAKELCYRYGLDTYVHTDPATGYNLRFLRPIEDVRNIDMAATCYTVGKFDGRTGDFHEVRTVLS